MDFKNMVVSDNCPCGRVHKVPIDKIIIEKGAINRLPECVADYGKKPFVLADVNTYEAAGEGVCGILEQSGIAYTKYIFGAGLGDMVAKYVSICEWRIAHVVTGEYYCENVAELVRKALKKCVDHAQNLLKRDESAVAAVFEGLVIGGIAMAYAGVSRPASGVEHYFSHIWDMRGLEFGTDVELHGIQCAVGTYLAVKLYGQMKKRIPDRKKALTYAASFDYSEWSRTLLEFLGKGAKAMIALEAKEHKYGVEEHAKRIEVIIEKWDKILEIMEEELPSDAEMDCLFDLTGMPKTPQEINIDSGSIPTTFAATKDIRDKYVLSRLAWDLGVLDAVKCL